jgi:hypothetical protein
VLTEFSEFFECQVFHKEIPRQDRLPTTIAKSVNPYIRAFAPPQAHFAVPAALG